MTTLSVIIAAMSRPFVHLHVHSEFSLVDSSIRLPHKPEEGLLNKAGKRANRVIRCVEVGLPPIVPHPGETTQPDSDKLAE